MKKVVIGIDTVGNGALSGPVMACAVVFLNNTSEVAKYLLDKGLNDSKKLSPKKRYYIESIINDLINKDKIHIGLYDNSSLLIDQLGIKRASLQAMHMATIRVLDSIGKLIPMQTRLGCILMIDGINRIPDLTMDQVTIIKGDQKIPEIMAASIMAKTARDQILINLSKEYPHFKWEKNKGYGSAEHIKAIKDFGLTPLHRRTFCQNFV